MQEYAGGKMANGGPAQVPINAPDRSQNSGRGGQFKIRARRAILGAVVGGLIGYGIHGCGGKNDANFASKPASPAALDSGRKAGQDSITGGRYDTALVQHVQPPAAGSQDSTAGKAGAAMAGANVSAPTGGKVSAPAKGHERKVKVTHWKKKCIDGSTISGNIAMVYNQLYPNGQLTMESWKDPVTRKAILEVSREVAERSHIKSKNMHLVYKGETLILIVPGDLETLHRLIAEGHAAAKTEAAAAEQKTAGGNVTVPDSARGAAPDSGAKNTPVAAMPDSAKKAQAGADSVRRADSLARVNVVGKPDSTKRQGPQEDSGSGDVWEYVIIGMVAGAAIAALLPVGKNPASGGGNRPTNAPAGPFDPRMGRVGKDEEEDAENEARGGPKPAGAPAESGQDGVEEGQAPQAGQGEMGEAEAQEQRARMAAEVLALYKSGHVPETWISNNSGVNINMELNEEEMRLFKEIQIAQNIAMQMGSSDYRLNSAQAAVAEKFTNAQMKANALKEKLAEVEKMARAGRTPAQIMEDGEYAYGDTVSNDASPPDEMRRLEINRLLETLKANEVGGLKSLDPSLTSADIYALVSGVDNPLPYAGADEVRRLLHLTGVESAHGTQMDLFADGAAAGAEEHDAHPSPADAGEPNLRLISAEDAPAADSPAPKAE